MILLTDSQWKTITTDGLIANAYVSIFLFPYLDERVFEIILIMALFGIMCWKSFKKVSMSNNIINTCIYGMILFAVVDLYVRFRFCIAEYAGGLILLKLFQKELILLDTTYAAKYSKSNKSDRMSISIGSE